MTPKSSRPPLGRQQVVAAALAIVDRDGLPALTMRALGRELGVDPMAAYHHVPNKAAVLDGVVEAVWSELDLPDPSDQPWQVQLVQIAGAMRATLGRHPHALPVIASRPNLSVPGFRLADRTLGVLLGAGLPAGEALAFLNAASEFVLGHALAESGSSSGGDDAIAAALLEAQESEELPHLTGALESVELSSVSADGIFDAGISTLVRGLEGRLADGGPRVT